MQVKPLLFFASVITVAFGTTAQGILNDLAALLTSATTLDNAIRAFPNTGGTLTQALAIHNDAVASKTVTETTIGDVQAVAPIPVSETDGNSILAAVEKIVPIIEDALVQIVAKKSGFDALPIGGISALVKQDLIDLCNDINNLANGLIGISPADLVGPGTAIKKEVNDACAVAIAAYANP